MPWKCRTVLVRMQRMLPWFRWFQCAALVPYLRKFFALHFPLQCIIRCLMSLLFHALPSSCSHRVVLLSSFDYPPFWLCTFYCFCNSSIFAYLKRCPPVQFTGPRSCTSPLKPEACCGMTLRNRPSNGRNWQNYQNCGSIAAQFPFAPGSLKTLPHLIQCS